MIFDNAIVNNSDSSGRIHVRVGIDVIWYTVRSPTGVAHAGRADDVMSGEFLVQVLDSAGLLRDLELTGG